MVYLNTVLDALATGIYQTGNLPDEMTYATLELDETGEHSDVPLPILELNPQDVNRDQSRNTEFAGYHYDTDGNQIGEIYQTWYDAIINANILTASDSNFDSHELEALFRDTMKLYDAHDLGQSLPDPDNPEQDEQDITHVVVREGTFPNDLSMSPGLRRARIQIQCLFQHDVSTVDIQGAADYVDAVTYADPGDPGFSV